MSLQDVYYVSGMKKNLFSVSHLTSLGDYILFSLQDTKVYRDVNMLGIPIIEERKLKSIYILLAEPTCVNKTRKNETIYLWHERLRYVSYH